MPSVNFAATQPVGECGDLHQPPVALRLDDIGRRHGTELSSLRRGCLDRWERYCPPRDQPFDLLEIGVDAGASLRTWRAWFPRARLVGLDVRRIALEPGIEDCRVVHGAQTDPEALRPLLRECQFRMIVDDGSSYAEDKIQTFLMLFPWLPPGSVYFCTGFDEQALWGPAPGDPFQPSARTDAMTVPEWFARFGVALAGDPSLAGPRKDLSAFGESLHRAREVAFLRGSVVITS